MAAVLNIRQKQCVVIEFLCCENETVGNIHKRLKKVYGDAAVDRSMVGWWASRGAIEKKENIKEGQTHSYGAGLFLLCIPVCYIKNRKVFTEFEETELLEYILQALNIYFGLSSKEVRMLAYQVDVANSKEMPKSWEEEKRAISMYLFWKCLRYGDLNSNPSAAGQKRGRRINISPGQSLSARSIESEEMDDDDDDDGPLLQDHSKMIHKTVALSVKQYQQLQKDSQHQWTTQIYNKEITFLCKIESS
ncbi:hypothetical protein ANN_14680 [Periplaneta americana]|uniref:Uncharacterized protein n=1 Tax=Periplaneta americana TaxID=6978 RepID=A0ABQ8SX17_PERAM|nr:hypothetical protein ANN_14680 [Periplaneta americana]